MRTNLTDRTIRTAKPRKSVYDLPDAQVPGLKLRVTPAGTKSWSWRHGQRRLTIGNYPAIGLAEARQIALRLGRAVSLGENPNLVLCPADDASPTFQGTLDRWLRDREAKGRRRAGEVHRALALHFADFLPLPIDRLTRRVIVERLEDIRDSGRPAAANRAQSRLSSVLNFAVERELIDRNPLAHLERVAIERAEKADRDGTKRVLTPDELARVWRAADALGGAGGDITKLLILTGCRRSEISSLRWSEIDFEERLLRIPASRMKAGRAHDVPLSDLALDILRHYGPQYGGPSVFGTTGRSPFRGWKHAAPTLRRLAGIAQPWTIHDLRRAVATHLVEQLDADGDLVARILAHTAGARLGSVTALYERSTRLDARRRILDAWSRWLGELLEGGAAANVVDLARAAGSGP